MIEISIENSTNSTLQSSKQATVEQSQSLLYFILAGQQYAVDLLNIREVRPMPALTRVVHSPDYILGVANLRGEIVPVVDLRKRFGFVDKLVENSDFDQTSQAQATPRLLIVTEIDTKRVAITVDEIREVCQIYPSEIKAIPRTALAMNIKYLLGMLQTDNGMVLLLDVAYMLSHDELHGLRDEREEACV